MVRYEEYCKVCTPAGIGMISTVDEISSPVIQYTVVLMEGGKVRTFAEQQIHSMIDTTAFDRYGKLIASETITAANGNLHFVFTYEYNHEIWYYSYYIDANGVKHIKHLEPIQTLGEE